MIADEGECWKAVVGRDAATDGALRIRGRHHWHLLPAVLPDADAAAAERPLLPDNAAAEAAGFCACKRCRPTAGLAARLARRRGRQGVRHARARASLAPSLAAVADAVGVSRFHFHRVFKEVLGTTPGEYLKAVRWRRLAQSLAGGRTVTEAIYGAGYGSISRAYENGSQSARHDACGMARWRGWNSGPVHGRRAGGSGKCWWLPRTKACAR